MATDTETTADTVMKVEYLQGKLNGKTPPDNHLMMKILKKLCQLPVTMEILQNTGIGRDINKLRKQEGKIGSMARSLVLSWKDLVRNTNRENNVASSAEPHPQETSSRLQSVPPKIKTESQKMLTVLPKIKLENQKPQNVNVSKKPAKPITATPGHVLKIKTEKPSSSLSKKPKPLTDTPKVHKSTGDTAKKKTVMISENKQTDIALEAASKGKSNDLMHKHLSPKKVKSHNEKTNTTTSPNRGLLVETVYTGSSSTANQDRSYNDFMQNTRTPSSGSDSETNSPSARSNLLGKKRKQKIVEETSHQPTNHLEKNTHHSGHSDLNEVLANEQPLDEIKKESVSPTKDTSHKRSRSESSSCSEASYYDQSPDRGPDISDSDKSQDSTYPSDSDDSFEAKEHPLDTLNKHNNALANKSRKESDENISNKSDSYYSDSGDSLLGTEHPLDKVKNIKKEIHFKSDIDDDSSYTKLKEKIEKTSKNKRKNSDKMISKKSAKQEKHQKDKFRTKSRDSLSKKQKKPEDVMNSVNNHFSNNSFQKVNSIISENKSKKHASSAFVSSVQVKSEPVDILKVSTEKHIDKQTPIVDSFDVPGQKLVESEDDFDDFSHESILADNTPGNTADAITMEKKDDNLNDIKSENSVAEKKMAPPVKRRKKKKIVDNSEKTFENTGLSFADCLGALQTAPIRKKSKKKPIAIVPSVKEVTSQKNKNVSVNKSPDKIQSKEKVGNTAETKPNIKPKSNNSSNHFSSTDKSDESLVPSSKTRNHLNLPTTPSHSGSRSNVNLNNSIAFESSVRPKKSSHSSQSSSKRSEKDGVLKLSSKSHSSGEHHRKEKKRSHDISNVSLHRDQFKSDSSSKSSKLTTVDKTNKEKSHHKNSHRTPKKLDKQKQDSERHKKAEQSKSEDWIIGRGVETSNESRGESRQERKRKWSTSADEAVIRSPKTRKEPVEVSLNLPDIQPDYKPVHMPVIEPRKKQVLMMDDPTRNIGSRNQKTKVFSGRVRHHALTHVPKLFDMCMGILCENIDALDAVGGVPAFVLKPVLERCTPQQLFHLEDVNPHFIDDTEEHWKKHSTRDFRKYQPEEFESWRDFFIRKYDERDAKFKSLKANIKATMAAKDPESTKYNQAPRFAQESNFWVLKLSFLAFLGEQLTELHEFLKMKDWIAR